MPIQIYHRPTVLTHVRPELFRRSLVQRPICINQRQNPGKDTRHQQRQLMSAIGTVLSLCQQPLHEPMPASSMWMDRRFGSFVLLFGHGRDCCLEHHQIHRSQPKTGEKVILSQPAKFNDGNIVAFRSAKEAFALTTIPPHTFIVIN